MAARVLSTGLEALGRRGATCRHVLASVEIQRVRAL